MKKTVLFTMAVLFMSAAFIYSNGELENKEYIHEKPHFSFKYDESYKAEPVQSPGEVIRLAMDNQFKLPVLVAKVLDQEEKGEDSHITKNFINRMKTGIPGTSHFEIMEEKPVKLNDGTDAYFFNVKWLWIDGVTAMQTVSVTVHKDNKLITLSGTALIDQDMLDEVTKMCMTLDVTL